MEIMVAVASAISAIGVNHSSSLVPLQTAKLV